jgi:hypothetical protein
MNRRGSHDRVVENDIETLAIALYVKIDDMLKKWPDLAPARPEGSIPPTVSEAELLTMAVMSALLGFSSERRWLRYATKNLAGMLVRDGPFVPGWRVSFWPSCWPPSWWRPAWRAPAGDTCAGAG